MEFRKLKPSEIELRVGSCTDKGFNLLLYKTARTDSNILDETVGAMNWQSDYKTIKDNLYCGIGIYDETKADYVWKWDCGTESYTEKEKGEASDAFKRAGFKWGIGRELYNSPFIWCFGNVETNEKGKYVPKIKIQEIKVTEIEYSEDRITKLVLKRRGQEFYSYNENNTLDNNLIDLKEGAELQTLIIKTDTDLEKFLKAYKVNDIYDLTKNQYENAKKILNKKLEKEK